MDKLRHIDELLKGSLGQSVEAGEYTSDWLAIEKRLKRRKNRIYAMWFSLALIALTSVSVLLYTYSTPANNDHMAGSNDQEKNIIDSDVDHSTTQNTESQDADNTPLTDPIEDIIESTGSTLDGAGTTDEVAQNDVTTNADPIDTPEETPQEENDGWEDPSVNMHPTNEIVILETELPDMSYAPAELEDVTKIKVAKITDVKPSGFRLGHTEIGVSFTPSMSGKFTSERSDLSWLINRDYSSKASSNESATFANNTSVNAEFHFTNGWFVGTGLGVAERTELLNYDYIIDHAVSENYPKQQLDYFTLAPPDWVYVSYQGSNSYHFVEIPLTIGYKNTVGKNLELRHQADLSYLFLYNKLGKKADYTSLELLDLADLDYLNNSNLSATIKSGLYYNFKNFVIGAEPTFSMNLTSLSNKNSAIKITPYNYGFNLTTNLKINQK